MIEGIDVASHQDETYDLNGRDFVVVKATEGRTYVNPKYAKQVAYGRSKGVVVGHYHYVNGSSDMEVQANYFVKTASEKPGEFLVLDWEEQAVSSAEKDAFLRRCKALAPGIKVGLYCNKSYWLNRDESDYYGDFLWIADPSSPKGKPDIKATWTIQQYGIRGNLDLNVANFKDRASMSVWAGKVTATPKPVYAPFPGASFFKLGKRHPIITAMGKRLVAEGYKGYKVGPGPEFTAADKAAYGWWQKKLGYKGRDADGVPGKVSWDRLKVPKS